MKETSPRPAVCIVVENLPLPFDRRVWQEARALRDAGFHVSIISPKGKGFEQSYESLEGIEIYRHRLLWEGAGLTGYLLEYSWSLMAEFWLALRIYRRTQFRILQACNPPDTIFLIGLFFKLFHVRFLFDHHDLSPELFIAKFGRKGFLYRLVRAAERWTFRVADAVIATNDSYKEVALGRGGMKREKVFVVRSCPDLTQLQRREARPVLKRGKNLLLLYLGVMGPQDGVNLLLEAFEHLVKVRGRDDTVLALVGKGSETARLKRLAVEKDLGQWVHFTGRVPHDELADYLSTADVCVAPDPKNEMNDKSTMNKILEYMAYGKPLVLFDLTEGRRSAADAALYARPNDPLDLAEKIGCLLDSEQLRHELGARGRKRIEAELNWEREKHNLLAAYEAALSRRIP